MTNLKKAINWLLASAEFSSVYALGRIFGVAMVVRYLRNPNPYVTVRLLRSFAATIGDRTTFKRSLIIDNSYEDQNSAGTFKYLKIGNNCYIGDCVYFDLSNEIILEDDVVLSGQVSLLTHADCNRSKDLAEKFPRQCYPVRINQGAWVGFKSTILAGVTVGHHCVLATNSVLREDAEPNSVYGGIPAKKIQSLEDAGQSNGARFVHPTADGAK